MRQITSKKAEEKKVKRNQLIGGSILIIMMLFSTVGYSLMSKNKSEEKDNTITYANYTFTQSNGVWNLQIEGFNFSFVNSPKEVPVFDSELNYLNSYDGKPLYIISQDSDAELEIYRNLFYTNSIVQRVQYACLEGEQCAGEYPIKTCQDNVIVIQVANTSSMKQQDNCVFIKGKAENLVKLSDSFLLKIIGLQ